MLSVDEFHNSDLNMPKFWVTLTSCTVASPFLCGISPHFVRIGDISLFICIREPSVCDLASIRKGEEPGYEALGMQ